MHDPQWLDVLISVSHPSAGSPLQSSRLNMHVCTQVPLLQLPNCVEVALHAVPQVPQFVLVLRAVSQPSATMPLQSPHPAAHEPMAHAPAAHDAVACGSEQTVPQVPQFAGSLEIATSQPFAAVPSQFARPALHAPRTHAPALHVALAPVNVHTRAQEPQLFGSDAVARSHPLLALASQSAYPAAHAPRTHAPLAQVAAACANEHALAHEPQLAGSVAVFTSQPFAPLPSQFAVPAVHVVITHAPLVHVAPAAQALPHDPQLAAVVMGTSHPFDAVPSQFA